MFKVYGTSAAFSYIPISTRSYLQGETLITNLTQMNSINMEISDNAGEIYYYTKALVV